MGYYFEINGEETNSKQISGILIDAIRKLESDPKLKQYNWFIPECRCEDGSGGGSWKIKRNGIAALLNYFITTTWDFRGYWRDYTIEENKEDLEDKIKREHLSEDEIEKKIKEYEKDIDEDIQWIIVYLARILSNMTLDRKRIAYGEWV